MAGRPSIWRSAVLLGRTVLVRRRWTRALDCITWSAGKNNLSPGTIVGGKPYAKNHSVFMV